MSKTLSTQLLQEITEPKHKQVNIKMVPQVCKSWGWAKQMKAVKGQAKSVRPIKENTIQI